MGQRRLRQSLFQYEQDLVEACMAREFVVFCLASDSASKIGQYSV